MRWLKMQGITKTVIRDFVNFCEDHILVGHNIMFDYKFMKSMHHNTASLLKKKGIDTLKIARKVHKDLESKSLEALCEHYQIVNTAAHRLIMMLWQLQKYII